MDAFMTGSVWIGNTFATQGQAQVGFSTGHRTLDGRITSPSCSICLMNGPEITSPPAAARSHPFG